MMYKDDVCSTTEETVCRLLQKFSRRDTVLTINTALAPDTLDDNHDDTSSKTDGPRMKQHGTVNPLSQASCV